MIIEPLTVHMPELYIQYAVIIHHIGYTLGFKSTPRLWKKNGAVMS